MFFNSKTYPKLCKVKEPFVLTGRGRIADALELHEENGFTFLRKNMPAKGFTYLKKALFHVIFTL